MFEVTAVDNDGRCTLIVDKDEMHWLFETVKDDSNRIANELADGFRRSIFTSSLELCNTLKQRIELLMHLEAYVNNDEPLSPWELALLASPGGNESTKNEVTETQVLQPIKDLGDLKDEARKHFEEQAKTAGVEETQAINMADKGALGWLDGHQNN